MDDVMTNGLYFVVLKIVQQHVFEVQILQVYV
jgi:hypothetical protein